MSLTPNKIMILDDNVLDVITIEEALRSAGYNDIVTQTSPNGALAKLDFERPEILLLEPTIDRLDPVGLMTNIRASPVLCDLVVVLLSGLDAEILQEWSIEYDAHGYYSKSMGINKIPAFLDGFYEE